MSKGEGAMYLLKAMLLAYMITAILLLTLSWICYKMDTDDAVIAAFVTLIYLLSTAIASFYVGKCTKSCVLLWGLMVGVLYALIICIMSIIMSGNAVNITADGLGTIMLCMGGGMLGAFISCMGK